MSIVIHIGNFARIFTPLLPLKASASGTKLPDSSFNFLKMVQPLFCMLGQKRSVSRAARI
jgi:hypothetical protein